MFQKTPWSKSPCWLLLLCTFEPWMQSELMTRILQTLNTRMKNAGRNIILFLDNAPCHPRELINMFSNIKVALLPKNANWRTQCLDTRVIKNWRAYVFVMVVTLLKHWPRKRMVYAHKFGKSHFWRLSKFVEDERNTSMSFNVEYISMLKNII